MRRRHGPLARDGGAGMHTVIVIAGGLLLLGIFLLVARLAAGASRFVLGSAARYFIPVWLVIAATNMWIGMRHGYSVMDEAPIFVIVFAVPAAVGYIIWRKLAPR
jgi:hypothetical protein